VHTNLCLIRVAISFIVAVQFLSEMRFSKRMMMVTSLAAFADGGF